MAVEHAVDHEARLVTATLRGALRLEDLLKYQLEVWSRPEFAGYDELVDMNGVTEVEADTTDNVMQLAAVSSSMDAVTGPSRLAIVAEHDYHFGLGRMYQVFREDSPGSTRAIGVFRTREEALRWLRSPGRAPG
jgi:hypothetical protein